MVYLGERAAQMAEVGVASAQLLRITTSPVSGTLSDNVASPE